MGKSIILVISLLGSLAIAEGIPGVGPFQPANCDDNEVISRACGLGGMLTPITRDPTGLGLTFSDLGNIQKDRVSVSKELGKITPEGFARFERAYKMVMTEYRAVAATLPREAQPMLNKRLDMFKFISREEIQKLLDNPMIRIQMKPATTVNAFYLPYTQSIYFLPAIMNNKYLSEAAYVMVLAHEMGHHLDPDLVPHTTGQAGQQRMTREDVAGKPGFGCFKNSFGNYEFTAEDWADWLAAMVMDRLIVRFPKTIDQLHYAQNTMKLFCFAIDRKRPANDPHAAPRDRILWVLRQPNLRKALNCTGAPQGMTRPACDTQGEVKYTWTGLD